MKFLPLLTVFALGLSLVTAACSGTSSSGVPGTGSRTDPNDPQTGDPSVGASTPTRDGGVVPSGDGSVPDPQPAATPIRIKNLSFTETVSGNSLGTYHVTFALENTSTLEIDRLTELTVTFDKGEPDVYALTCGADFDWFVKPGKTTGVLEISIQHTSQSSYLAYAPGCSSLVGPYEPGGASTMTLQLKGLFQDASTWKADATGTK